MDDGKIAGARVDYESGVSTTVGLEVRIWLRLLTCANLIGHGVRQNLHHDYATTLPRFDILAQLDRAGEALSMGELSQRLMVTNGNITGLIDRLVRDGLVAREPAPNDRRMQLVRLTETGRALFAELAADHSGWVTGMMAGIGKDDLAQLYDLLARLKGSVLDSRREEQGDATE